MRRAAVILIGLLLGFAGLPQSASARGLPGLLGAITNPIGSLFRGGRHVGRHRHLTHHRATRSRAVAGRRHVPAAATAAAATPPVAAAAATSSEPPAHQPDTPESDTKTSTSAVESAKPATKPEQASPDAAPIRVVPPAPVTTASAPATDPDTPAPAGRHNAALSLHSNAPPVRKEQAASSASSSPSSIGVVGPLTWPAAFEDVVGYALWPQQYEQRLRSHGIADVLGAVFVAPATLAAKAQPVRAKAADVSGTASTTADGCTNAGKSAGDWPASDIERLIELTEPQRSALGQLKAAIRSGVQSIAATCRDTAELSPIERLHAMQKTLWAVHDAALLVRAPLDAFYNSLTDEQKKRFAAPSGRDMSPQRINRDEMARLCGMPASLESSMRQIDRSLQATKGQRASLDAFNKKAFEMGQFLMASCLKPVPATPAERIDGAADRLTAMLFAASNLAPALNDFYAQLNDTQKERAKSLR